MLASAVFKAMPAPRRPRAPGNKADPKTMARFAERLRRLFTEQPDTIRWQVAARAIDRGELHVVEDALASEAVGWADRFVAALGDTYVDAANAELARVGARMRLELFEKARKKIPRSENRFPGVPHSDEFIRGRAASLVVRVSQEQRQAIREAIAARYNRTSRPETLVRDLRNTIGLDPRRARALRNFENSLRDAGAKNVQGQVERYREKLLRNRAETIARTESVAVENAARVEA